MKAKTPAVAMTPSSVHWALLVNIVLLGAALAMPNMVLSESNSDTREGAGASMLFAIPMALILIIGIAAATHAYLLARRESLRMKWTAYLPLVVFLIGLAAALALANSGFFAKSQTL